MNSFLNTAAAILLTASVPALEAQAFSGDVDIDVISPQGYVHTLYHVEQPRRASHGNDDAMRAWLEAKPGEPYALRVRNRTGRRVGVVLAVDGRNIISGKRSSLSRREAMYILEPYQSAVYEGWRTGRDRVNEFYFTREQHSYAAAFEDYSAMGLISAAVYRDAAPRYRGPDRYADGKRAPDSSGKGVQPQGKAGTGFGDERYSPSRQVAFDAQRSPSAVMLVRYEWRGTLCEMGIMRCHRAGPSERNRLWDRRYDTQFAPYPPSRPYEDEARQRWWR